MASSSIAENGTSPHAWKQRPSPRYPPETPGRSSPLEACTVMMRTSLRPTILFALDFRRFQFKRRNEGLQTRSALSSLLSASERNSSRISLASLPSRERKSLRPPSAPRIRAKKSCGADCAANCRRRSKRSRRGQRAAHAHRPVGQFRPNADARRAHGGMPKQSSSSLRPSSGLFSAAKAKDHHAVAE